MTVAELIEKLKNLNQPDAKVVVFHYGHVINVDPSDEYNKDEVCIRTDSEDF
jgi:hypothetical protein